MQKVAALFVVSILCLCCLLTVLRAQETTEKSEEKPAPEKNENRGQQARAVQPYRLDFSFYELEDGKKINTRHYSLNLTAGSRNDLKIGTRVPVAVGNDGLQYQYMDVGTRIWANVAIEGGGDLRLDVTSEVSNLDTHQSPGHSANLQPVVRQIQINGNTLLITGKPMLIGSVDDPNSNRQFQLEVTATKLR